MTPWCSQWPAAYLIPRVASGRAASTAGSDALGGRRRNCYPGRGRSPGAWCRGKV